MALEVFFPDFFKNLAGSAYKGEGNKAPGRSIAKA